MYSQWLKWRAKRNIGTGWLDIQLVKAETFTEDGAFALFKLKVKDAVDIPFMLGIYEDSLNGLFKSDYSGECSTSISCRWVQEMGNTVGDIVSDGGSLEDVLNACVKTYVDIDRTKRFRETKTVTVRTKWPGDAAIKEITSNKSVTVTVLTEDTWMLEVDFNGGVISASLILHTQPQNVTKYHCELRVLSPRLDTGGNVDYGGHVTYKGLSAALPSRTIKDMLVAIAAALKNERVLEGAPDYTEEEYRSATTAKTVKHTHDYILTAKLAKLASYGEIIDDSAVEISFERYSRLIENTDDNYVFMRLESAVGLVLWVVAYPNHRLSSQEIVLSNIAMVNLNCANGELLHVGTGIPPVTSSVVVRPKEREGSINVIQEINKGMEGMKVLTAGCVYSVGEILFEVHYAGEQGACRLTEKVDVELITLPSVLKEIDPLEVPYGTYTEESSEESD